MKNDILEKIYKGVLAKVIGVRYGSPVEMWSSEEIKEKYSGVDGYFTEYHDYAADDDLNGPIFFFKALNDSCVKTLSALDIAKTWINYVPYNHGFYWWGGYGVSSEHTAYINIKNGIMPPLSGSALQNTKIMSNQIGGQIFSDFWGLVAPNNPHLASHLAGMASSVSHDEEALNGGKYIASLISIAFNEKLSIKEIMEEGLNYIPEDSIYAYMVKDIIRVYESGISADECFKYIKTNYWKDKYGGNCHVIPNSAIMAYSMLYGEGDFIKSIKICNYSGFDTDCTCGNIATILGVHTSLNNVDYDKWIKPINDSIICSSAFGYLNILNIPAIAIDIYNKSLMFKDEEDINYKDYKLDLIDLKFIFDNSTSGLRFSDYLTFNTENNHINLSGFKDKEYIYYKTYYGVNDFTDNRYDPCTSPKAYPGETIKIDYKYQGSGDVYIYYKDYHTKKIYLSKKDEKELLIQGKDNLIYEVGLYIENVSSDFNLSIDSFKVEGKADYEIDFSKQIIEDYTLYHKEISGCAYYDGLWILEDSKLNGRGFNDSYLTTSKYLKYFNLTYNLNFKNKPYGGISFLMKGIKKNYTLIFDSDNQLIKLIKYDDFKEYVLSSLSYEIKENKDYQVFISSVNKKINISINGEHLIDIEDENRIDKGMIGVYTNKGSIIEVKNIKIKEL